MNSEQYQRVKEIFHAAAGVEPSSRGKVLDEACNGDDVLREEVESLLSFEERAEEFIERSAFTAGARLLTSGSVDSLRGRRIGQYSLLAEIGHGGMGVVYRAARADDQFKKEVAIKIVRIGLDTEETRRRFSYERQILASLDHPHIAKLLDAGTTEEGLPYLVMDAVEGKAIDDFCNEKQLSTKARLELFQLVCGAVQFAHQRLVIHRDIKPGNILVTENGTPKLLDFGIAKLLDPSFSNGLGNTATDLRVMTPEYASPEQVMGKEITTASDVYSLGVLLYELLTGYRPYRVNSNRPGELVRAISDQEPFKPSETISRHVKGDKRAPVAASGDRDRAKELRGDLDNIVLMAIQKDAERRYASVAEFSEDIRRHLNGLPVIARPDTITYRTRKFVNRHRLGVAAAAMILVALIAGVVATAWQARVAARQRDQARIEKTKAERINTFMQSILSSGDPLKQRRDVTVAEALDDAARRAEVELANEPEVLAAVRWTIGLNYVNQGRFDLAEKEAQAALDLNRRLYGDQRVETARAMLLLGFLNYQKGKFDLAEPLLRGAVTVYRAQPEPSLDSGHAVNNLGLLQHDKGDEAAAIPLYEEALKIFRKVTGENSFKVALSLNNLAASYQATGDFEKAQQFYDEAISICRKLSDPEGQALLATSLQNSAVTLKTKGRYKEAQPGLLEAIQLRRKILGEQHPYVAITQIHLAELYYLEGDNRRAESEIISALNTQKQALPAGHVDFGRSLTVLGSVLTKKGELVQAEATLREALEIRRKVLKPGHWLIAMTKGALGECLVSQKRFAEAESLLVESYGDIKTSQGEKNPRTAEAIQKLINLYEAWNRSAESARYRALLPAIS
jgi:serine/threonine-protein kinase